MKVLNLRCTQQHCFEGWFASEDDHREQAERGLLSCPVCGDVSVHRLPSAPHLHLGPARKPAQTLPEGVPVAASHSAAPAAEPPAHLVQALRELMDATEDVGEQFADQARAMHQGDLEPRGIRGRTRVDVAVQLLEEGVPILPLPSLPPLKRTLH